MPTANTDTSIDRPQKLSFFQSTYSSHLRNSNKGACPKGIPPRRSQVYEELVFNNTQSFIDRCFPVTKSLLSSEQWLHLVSLFFQNWSCHTPYFSQIPFEFVGFISEAPETSKKHFPDGLPDWLGSLLHYEWIELEVELSSEIVAPNLLPKESWPSSLDTILDIAINANPTLKNLQYEWPVHNICPENIPENPILTHLLVYRTAEHQVQFMEINALTSVLIQIIDTETRTVKDALEQLITLIPTISSEQAMQFGLPLINDLLNQKILQITANNPELSE